ncbi:uncharacterized protein LOC129587760 [Paramacrobiotus metropolitanus]|uniref:uncharacterized protein LOC129587760 n=1 Tax=Paramacrobiotus metropolitanus TaxID=2943436 RepID=UPI002445C005|nr:uncharacterized protein LOC129587760 [Paramacrobiotus metropolitanus]
MTFSVFGIIIAVLLLGLLWYFFGNHTIPRAEYDSCLPECNPLPEERSVTIVNEEQESSCTPCSGSVSIRTDCSASSVSSDPTSSIRARLGQQSLRKEERVWGLRKKHHQVHEWALCKLLQGSSECFTESESFLVHFFSDGGCEAWLPKECILPNTEKNRSDIIKFNYDLKRNKQSSLRKNSSLNPAPDGKCQRRKDDVAKQPAADHDQSAEQTTSTDQKGSCIFNDGLVTELGVTSNTHPASTHDA